MSWAFGYMESCRICIINEEGPCNPKPKPSLLIPETQPPKARKSVYGTLGQREGDSRNPCWRDPYVYGWLVSQLDQAADKGILLGDCRFSDGRAPFFIRLLLGQSKWIPQLGAVQGLLKPQPVAASQGIPSSIMLVSESCLLLTYVLTCLSCHVENRR